jgi:polysaccharide biosynthesis/export protein
MTSLRPLLALGLFATLGSGCASVGSYVWVDQVRVAQPRASAEYVIAQGDLIAVRVYGQEALSGRMRVRPDGKISVPMINDHQAAGLTPSTLAQLIETELKTFVKVPIVTVTLEEPHPCDVAVLGQVVTAGIYRLEQSHGVLHVIAQAGGVTPFAHRDRIFVLRRAEEGAPLLRVRFTYNALLSAEPHATGFALEDGDVVVVE